MKIDINEYRQIRLIEVFDTIELQSTSGESIFVCMRDGGFEIMVESTQAKNVYGKKSYTPYAIRDGQISPLAAMSKFDNFSDQE